MTRNTDPPGGDARGGAVGAFLVFVAFAAAAGFFARFGIDDKEAFPWLVVSGLCAIVMPLLIVIRLR